MISPGHGWCKGQPDPSAFPRKTGGRALEVPFLSLGTWGLNGLAPHRRGPERQPIQGCSAAVEPRSLPGRSRSRAGAHVVDIIWSATLGWPAGKPLPPSSCPPRSPAQTLALTLALGPNRHLVTSHSLQNLVLINTHQLIRKARDPAGREETPVLRTVCFFLLSYLFLVFLPVSFSCAQCLT